MLDDPAADDWDARNKIGQGIRITVTTIRNYGFHKKYFALLNVGYDNWNPPAIDTKYGTPQKNFARFRENIAIRCGFYDLVFNIDGTYAPKAKSISFASMEENEFQKLYSETIDLFIRDIYGEEMTPERIDEIVEQYLAFA